MSRHRHEMAKKARGGPMTNWSRDDEPKGEGHDGTDPSKDVYAGKGSQVDKEAEEGKKRGGRTKRAHGGRTMKAMGGKAKHHMHRPGRKRGGGVGSELRPLTSAAHGTDASGHKTGSAGDAEVD